MDKLQLPVELKRYTSAGDGVESDRNSANSSNKGSYVYDSQYLQVS